MRNVVGGLMLGVVLLACAGEAATPLVEAGERGVGVTSGAESAGAAGSAGTNGDAGSDGALAGVLLGDELPLVVTRMGPVPYAIGDNPHGIRGAAFLLRSERGNRISVAETPGELCVSGQVDAVQNLDYAGYWGVELGFELGSVTPDAPPGEPWRPGRVIGFSYVIEGPTISPIRFLSLPAGYDPELDSSVFCKDIGVTSGPESSLFSEVTRACWDAGGEPLPLADGLVRISWQLRAATEPVDRPFDWCLKQLRPLLSGP